MLKAETDQSVVANTASDMDPILNMKLQNAANWLASEADWAFLRHRWDVPLVADTRYYNLPTTTSAVGDEALSFAINFDRPVVAEVYYNGRWDELEYGVDSKDFDYLNSDGPAEDGVNPQTQDPIQRWRLATNANEPTNPNQFEVWPVPASTGVQMLRFTGQRALVPFATWAGGVPTWNDAAKCDLDDLLVIQAVKALNETEIEKQRVMLEQLQRRLIQLRGFSPQREEKHILGRNLLRSGSVRRIVPIIVAPH